MCPRTLPSARFNRRTSFDEVIHGREAPIPTSVEAKGSAVLITKRDEQGLRRNEPFFLGIASPFAVLLTSILLAAVVTVGTSVALATHSPRQSKPVARGALRSPASPRAELKETPNSMVTPSPTESINTGGGAASTPTVPGRTRLFGISVPSSSAIGSVAGLAQTLDRRVDVINLYSDWTSGFPTQQVRAIAATGATPAITWEPWDHVLGPTQDMFPLTSIATGTFDGYIRQWAEAAAKWNAPIYLRFAHEMNGDWYPWCVGLNDNSTQTYIAAYSHVHAIFQAAGATNASWIWSPNVIWRAGTDPSSSYPGPAEVDYIGIDGYNAGTAIPGGSWAPPLQIFGPTLSRVSSFAPDKPVIITETGSGEAGGNKAAWIADLLSYLESTPSVVGIIWSEYTGRADWPIETSAAAEQSMTTSLARYWAP